MHSEPDWYQGIHADFGLLMLIYTSSRSHLDHGCIVRTTLDGWIIEILSTILFAFFIISFGHKLF